MSGGLSDDDKSDQSQNARQGSRAPMFRRYHRCTGRALRIRRNVVTFGAAPKGAIHVQENQARWGPIDDSRPRRHKRRARRAEVTTITVTDNGSGLAASSTSPTSFSSHFTASGCGFRANDSNYELVVRGPGLYTSSLTYWVDAFRVGSNGCGRPRPVGLPLA